MRIFISAPYTLGDQAANVRAAIDAAELVAAKGHIPFVPHLFHFWHLIHPHQKIFWVALDLAWLDKCHAILILPGCSIGSEQEEARARYLGKTIFYSITTIPTVVDA
jgi:hypothetical protein